MDLPRRRLFRFSLRFLAIVVTAFTIWFGLTATRANRQRRAVESIERHGGQFWYDYQVVVASKSPSGYREIDPFLSPPGPEWLRGLLDEHYFVTPIDLFISDRRVIDKGALALVRDLDELEEITLTRLPLGDADVAQLPKLKNLRCFRIDASFHPRDNRIEDFSFLRGFPRLEELYVSFQLFGDDDAQYLSSATELRELGLGNTLLGDEGLRHLASLTKLEVLGLTKTKITDVGVARLKSLANLQHLNLNATAVTDEGLKHLRSLPKLASLDLVNTAVTDAGLEHLKSIRSLKRVDLIGAPISDQGVREFLEAMPQCRVRTQWDH